jgi:hypothetical protein
VVGLKAQVIPAGATHEKVTRLEKPLAGVTVSAKFMDPPATTMPDCGDAASEKVWVPSVAAASAPNKPWPSLARPAVK